MSTPEERLIEILERIERRLDLLEGRTNTPTDQGGPTPADASPKTAREPEPQQPAPPPPPAQPATPTPAPTPSEPLSRDEIDESTPQSLPSLVEAMEHLRERKQAARQDDAPAQPMRSIEEMQSVATGRRASSTASLPTPPPPPSVNPVSSPKPAR